MAKIDLETIHRLEERLRHGDQAFVSTFLREMSRSEVPDSLKLSLCQIARRAGLARKGLVLLHDRVVATPPGFKVNPKEQSEYAACLLKLGGVTEARALLRQVPMDRIGEAVKYLAFCCIHQWDYGQAVPLLKEYIARPDTPTYDRRVGSINLSAALIGLDRFDEAQELLSSLLEPLDQAGNRLLLGNVNELLAQIHIHTRQFDLADRYLNDSWNILKQAQPRYLLYLEKWRAVANLMQYPKRESALESLNRTRSKAIENGEWEVVRECDFYRSIVREEGQLFQFLFVGTPYNGYRNLMVKKTGEKVDIPESFVWKCAKKSAGEVNVESGQFANHSLFPKNQGRHRLLKALSMDFYAPAPITELFHQIFDGEHFNPNSSPARIHELIRHFRHDVHLHALVLPILSLKGAYKIDIFNSNCDLLVKCDRAVQSSLLSDIEARYGDNSFRLKQLAIDLARPHTSVYRDLKELIQEGQIEVQGTGRNSSYRIKKNRAKSA